MTSSQEDVVLQYNPVYVLVKVTNAKPDNYVGIKTVADQVVIPLAQTHSSKTFKVELQLRDAKVNIQTKSHGVELGYYITLHKIEGQTCQRIIVDLNYRPFKPQISFSGFYVHFTIIFLNLHICLLRCALTAANWASEVLLFRHPSPLSLPCFVDNLERWRSSNYYFVFTSPLSVTKLPLNFIANGLHCFNEFVLTFFILILCFIWPWIHLYEEQDVTYYQYDGWRRSWSPFSSSPHHQSANDSTGIFERSVSFLVKRIVSLARNSVK
jgi:hypothetical protein